MAVVGQLYFFLFTFLGVVSPFPWALLLFLGLLSDFHVQGVYWYD
jgi:hypothetical protein